MASPQEHDEGITMDAFEEKHLIVFYEMDEADRVTAAEKIASQYDWDEINDPLPVDGIRAVPTPVEVVHPAAFEPLFDWLRSGRNTQQKPRIGFERGMLYSDGRLDLCMMGIGPDNIDELLKSLRKNAFVKHMLLGNNIIGPVGAEAITQFLHDDPNQIETWYLAANCLDASAFSTISQQMTQSTSITSLWLKRNPLEAASVPAIFRLIERLPHLRTLDLDQTQLGDAGISHLFELMATSPACSSLKHIFLNGTGISRRACEAISNFLFTPHCCLQSLYMSSNPIGDHVKLLAPGIEQSTIKRLVLQSCGLKDKGTLLLLAALANNPNLEMLDLGQGYATDDLGMRYNWLTKECYKAIVKVVEDCKCLAWLSLSYQPMTYHALCLIASAVEQSNSIVVFEAKPLPIEIEQVGDWEISWNDIHRIAGEKIAQNIEDIYDGMTVEQFEHSRVKASIKSPSEMRNVVSAYLRDPTLVKGKVWDDNGYTLARVKQGKMILTAGEEGDDMEW